MQLNKVLGSDISFEIKWIYRFFIFFTRKELNSYTLLGISSKTITFSKLIILKTALLGIKGAGIESTYVSNIYTKDICSGSVCTGALIIGAVCVKNFFVRNTFIRYICCIGNFCIKNASSFGAVEYSEITCNYLEFCKEIIKY